MTEPILIVGATGLVGKLLIQQLMASEAREQLHILVRSIPDQGYDSAKIHFYPNHEWPHIIKYIRPYSLVSCLGSTIKKAGSERAFVKIDRDLVTTFARAAKTSGTKHFLTVSSVMANVDASNLYLRTKGEIEELLQGAHFTRLDIIRPGLLLGERDEFRFGESLASFISPLTDFLLRGSFNKFRSIEAKVVAKALAELLRNNTEGVFVHENRAICTLAQNWDQAQNH